MLPVMILDTWYIGIIWLVNAESYLVMLELAKVSDDSFHSIKVTSSRGAAKL